MKHSTKIMAAAGLIWMLLAAAPGMAGPPQSEKEILQLLQGQEEAWNRGDLEGFMAGYWNSDQLTFFSAAQIQNGWQSTVDRYRRRYQAEGRSMGRLAFSRQSIEMLCPESALVRGRWQLEMPDGARPAGLYTLIVKKLPQGWRIIHDHTSSQQ